MRVLVPMVLVAVLLAPAVAGAQAAPAPTDAFAALRDDLARGDVEGAKAAYEQGLHQGLAARDPALDANVTEALAGPNATQRAGAIEARVLVGAYEIAFAANGSDTWRAVLAQRFPANATASPEAAQRAFAGEVRQRLDAALFAWDEPSRAAAEAEAAQVAFGPVAPALAPVVGAPYAAQAADEMASFGNAVASGDRAEATTASEVLGSILGDFVAPPTTPAERLAKVVSAASLLASEYDAYVHDGQLVEPDAYRTEVLGVFAPTLESRWAELKPTAQTTWPAQAPGIDAAVAGMLEKVRAQTPNAQVRAQLDALLAAVGSLAPGPAVSDFAADAQALHDAVAAAIAKADAGDRAGALAALQSAYVDLYGPRLEPRVAASSPAINAQIESVLTGQLPDAIRRGASASELAGLATQLDAKVEEARVLAAGDARSDVAMFGNSFLILLREGFETILVLGALATYLIRTGHKAKAPLLYAGAGVGVLATLLLYLAVHSLVESLPISRDILEGVTALLAVIVLFYVSYWLISKIEVGKWNRFIQGKMKGALAEGNGYALAGVAFLAVFREGFETVLFYQGLYGNGGHDAAITSGVVVGAIVLALVFVGFYRFGVRIPMRAFFIATSILLYYLAIAFAGQGLHELQDGGVVSTTLVTPLVPLLTAPGMSDVASLLGIFPTVETLALQAALLLAIAGGLAWTLVWEPRRGRAEA